MNREPSHVPFIVLASLLAAVTYLESVLVEYPLRWLSATASLATLALMLAVQLCLCAALYRHLRRNSDAYSPFFSRATLVALAAYLALTVLFLLPQGAAFIHHDIGGLAAGTAAMSA